MKNTILSAIILLNVFAVYSQTIVRGPYLQSPTHESITVMWRTNISTSSKVWYGTDPDNLTDFEIIYDNVIDHTVLITGLLPATRYYYKVGDANNELAPDAASQYFKTHPIPGTTVPTRVWAIGDFGRGNQGQVAMKQAFENYSGDREADVWIWLGDNAYNDGTDAQYQSKVFAVNGFSDIFSHLPFYPSPGNHDYNTVWAESTTLGIPYTNIPLENHEGPYFDMVDVPEHAEAGGFPSHLEVFYSYDYGDVHFLSLNSEVFDYTFSYDGINRMKQWIEADLQQNTRKFTIAYFHQPPYSKGSHDSDDLYELVMKAMREKVIPLLEQYDIDLVVCGHSHVFERSYLIKGHYGYSDSFDPGTMLMQNGVNGNYDEGTPYIKDNSYSTPEGTIYVVCGNSGSSESSPTLDHPAMYFGHGDQDAMGSFIIDVDRNRLDGKYLTKEGAIADQFTILKKDLDLSNLPDHTICLGESIDVAALYTGGSYDINYVWSETDQTDSIVNYSPTETTEFTLTVTDNLTGQQVSESFTINVLPAAGTEITEPIPGVLAAASGSNYTYQWYLNDNLISGATSQYYQPMFNGVYHVVITNIENGCTTISEEYSYPSTLGLTSSENENFLLFPNPASEKITLVIPDLLKDANYTISDASGRIVLQGNVSESFSTVQISNLAKGSYTISLKSDQVEVQQSFLKQ